ncbi:MAG: hypothetical protein WC842_03530 [Candidatus Paceibacterota bacterium]|jgi:hypothetical protein
MNFESKKKDFIRGVEAEQPKTLEDAIETINELKERIVFLKTKFRRVTSWLLVLSSISFGIREYQNQMDKAPNISDKLKSLKQNIEKYEEASTKSKTEWYTGKTEKMEYDPNSSEYDPNSYREYYNQMTQLLEKSIDEQLKDIQDTTGQKEKATDHDFDD